MKKLVVYYSRTGITKRVAAYLAETMACDSEEIIDLADRRGPKGYLLGGKDAATKKLTPIKTPQKEVSTYDIIIIGTPVWAFTMAPAVRTYLTKNKEKLKEVAFFCTEGGAGGKKTFKDMEEICGRKPKGTFEITEREVKKESYKSGITGFIDKIR